MTKPTGRRGRQPSTRDKVVSSVLAVGAAAGVTGLLAYQSVQASDAAAATPAADPTSAGGQTADQLTAYASQLADEQARLDAYRAQLVDYRNQLAAASGQTASTSATTPAPVATPAPKVTAAPKPVTTPKAAPAPKVHATTKGS